MYTFIYFLIKKKILNEIKNILTNIQIIFILWGCIKLIEEIHTKKEKLRYINFIFKPLSPRIIKFIPFLKKIINIFLRLYHHLHDHHRCCLCLYITIYLFHSISLYIFASKIRFTSWGKTVNPIRFFLNHFSSTMVLTLFWVKNICHGDSHKLLIFFSWFPQHRLFVAQCFCFSFQGINNWFE